MFRSAAVLLLSVMVPMAASAAPATLTDQQMDYITAGHKDRHHRDGFKLFGKTVFILKGKYTKHDSDFQEKRIKLHHFADLGVGVASGWGVAVGGQKYDRKYDSKYGKKYGKGYKPPFARAKSFVGYKGKVDFFKTVSDQVHFANRKFAWAASYAVGIAVDLNKYFYKLRKWDQKKKLAYIKDAAHKALSTYVGQAKGNLAPPKLIRPLQ